MTFAALALTILLSGCGGGSTASDTVANLLAFNTTRAPELPPQKATEPESDELCPTVDIAENGAAHRSYAGPANNQTLRHQISITDVARQCTLAPGGGYVLKVGVEARLLIGPAGNTGTYSAPFRLTVKRGDKVVATRQRVASASITAGQGNTTFTLIEEGISVPPGPEAVTIEVSMGGGPASADPRRKARR
jgi:hypothetical protein